jgi:hypothetical protein
MTIDITPEAVYELWEDYIAASRPDNGDNTGGIELYDIEGMNDAAYSMYETLRALSAALTASQAETAAAYEVAAGILDKWAANLRDDGFSNAAPVVIEKCSAMIRALTPADSKAALDRMIADAEERGMREAAAIANTLLVKSTFGTTDRTVVTYSDFVAAVILAAIPKGKDHE